MNPLGRKGGWKERVAEDEFLATDNHWRLMGESNGPEKNHSTICWKKKLFSSVA